MNTKKRRKTIAQLFAEGRPIDAAIRKAAREACLRHKLLGQPIVVWRNGKTVLVPPEDIPGPKARQKKTRTGHLMAVYSPQLMSEIDGPWLDMEPIVVGQRPAKAGTPRAHITVERDGNPFARIDVHMVYRNDRHELISWGRFILLGLFADAVVYVVDPALRETHVIECGGYFWCFYPLLDCLLVATADELIRLDADGCVQWTSERLGIDGVVIERIDGDSILGKGEWDPPGGWRPFQLSLATGRAK